MTQLKDRGEAALAAEARWRDRAEAAERCLATIYPEKAAPHRPRVALLLALLVGAGLFLMLGVLAVRSFGAASRLGREAPIETPLRRSHEDGARLILAAVRAGPEGAGDWYPGLGLLGASLLETSVANEVGFATFFSQYVQARHKLTAATRGPSWALLLNGFSSVDESATSLVARREAQFALIAHLTSSRFEFGPKGEYGFSPAADSRRSDTKALGASIPAAIQLVEQLGAQGVTDCVLADAIGVAEVVVERDMGSSGRKLSRPTQFYRDTLTATLGVLERGRGIPDFLETLGREMENRGLYVWDTQGIFSSKTSRDSFARLVGEDLAALRERVPR
jgi:hypothetical protein